MMTLKILSPDKELYSGKIKKGEFPGAEGRFQILPGHAPLCTELVKGTIHYTDNESKSASIDLESALLKVSNNVITVLVN